MDVVVNKVSTNWDDVPGGLTWYFIGQPKTGKTTAASQWSKKGSEGVLLIDTALGADFVDDANVVTVNAVNPPLRELKKDGKTITKNGKTQTEIIPPKERGFKFRSGTKKGEAMPVYSMAEILSWLRNNWAKLPYDTIVIDTIDEVNKWIEASVLEELDIPSMGEGNWGADWGLARRKNLDIVVKFQKFVKQHGGNLVLISHSKATTITDGKAQLSPDLPRGLAYSLTAKADVIGYTTANRDNGQFYISFKSYDERTVGSRLRPLAQKDLLFNYSTVSNEILTYKEENKNGNIQTS